MRPEIVLALLLVLPYAHAGSSCEISGDALLWAYDACLWRSETDDTLHLVVISCVDKNRALIAKVGACQAKRIFKGRICTLARQWQLEEPDPSTCMAVDRPLGVSVRDGGIWWLTNRPGLTALPLLCSTVVRHKHIMAQHSIPGLRKLAMLRSYD